MNERIEKLREKLTERNLDSIVIKNRKNVFYFSGFTGTTAYLIIGMDCCYIVTDFRYLEQAAAQCAGFSVIDRHNTDMAGLTNNFQNTGFEDLTIGYLEFQTLNAEFQTLTPVGDLIAKLRAVKSPEEAANIKKAAAIADEAFLHVLSFAKPGMEEREIALELEYFMRRRGAAGTSFDTIVASGIRGAYPHGYPTEKKLEYGDLVVLDFGCVYQGYMSDMTRTFGVGEVPKAAQEAYDKVLEAQMAVLDAIGPAASLCGMHRLAARILDAAYPGRFGHALGHSVGLDIHESPNLSPKAEGTLCPGNVVTVEPGVYLPGSFGVRIEDLIYITEDGYENFTASPKDLRYIS